MNHKAVQDNFLNLLEGRLDALTEVLITDHLNGCPGCKRVFDDYRAVTRQEEILAEEKHHLGPDFSVKVMEVIEGYQPKWRWRFMKFQNLFKDKMLVPTATLAIACLAVIVVRENIDHVEDYFHSPYPDVLRRGSPTQTATGSQEPEALVGTEVQSSESADGLRYANNAHQGSQAITKSSTQEERQPAMPPGYRAVTIPVETTAGVEGFVAPGKRADVMLTYFDSTTGKSITRLVSEGNKVLSVGGNSIAGEKNQHLASNAAATVTLQVPIGEALKIRTAKALGGLSLNVSNESDFLGTRVAPEDKIFSANSWREHHSDRILTQGKMSMADPRTGKRLEWELRNKSWKPADKEQNETQNFSKTRDAGSQGSSANSGGPTTQTSKDIAMADRAHFESRDMWQKSDQALSGAVEAKSLSATKTAPSTGGQRFQEKDAAKIRHWGNYEEDRLESFNSPQPSYSRLLPTHPYSTTPTPSEAEVYAHYEENPRLLVSEEPVSTFSIDVDTGSYSNVRRFLQMGKLPPNDAVRIEELINYFDYNYPTERDHPFGVHYEIAPSPLERDRYLLKVGVKARDGVQRDDRGWNLVFLIDVSGSMSSENKLPLLKRSLRVLVNEMRSIDRLAIVTYADGAAVALPSTSGQQKEQILAVVDRLSARGGTNGGAGIELAYQIAQENRRNDGVNRVILATDGDFNVGISSFDGLMRLIEQKRRSGVTLTTLGFGEANLNEQNLERLADAGNGNYFYLDFFNEARKVLGAQLVANMEVVAKDVKLQMEFNPLQVKAYRLIGFDNRKLEREDFSDDRVDAGEVGAGHTVTVLYELVLAKSQLADKLDGDLRYKENSSTPAPVPAPKAEVHVDELAFLEIRYKEPNSEDSKLISQPLRTSQILADSARTSDDFRFAAAVSYFGHLLRASKFAGSYSIQDIKNLAQSAKGADSNGYRQEFLRLVENAGSVWQRGER